MPRGGRRPVAGRKSKDQLQKWRMMLDECIQPEDWQAIIQKVYDEATALLNCQKIIDFSTLWYTIIYTMLKRYGPL